MPIGLICPAKHLTATLFNPVWFSTSHLASMYTCCSIFNKKPKLHHHQQPPDRLKIQSLATKTPPLSMNKNPNFLPHSLQVSFLYPLHIDRMSLELGIMDMDDKLVVKGENLTNANVQSQFSSLSKIQDISSCRLLPMKIRGIYCRNFSLSTKCTMDIDDKLVAKVHCTTKLEGEIKLLYSNIAYLTLSSNCQ
ncbi:hypothetical protein Hanom_Chr06g00519851 [Helianthus anomalus]